MEPYIWALIIGHVVVAFAFAFTLGFWEGEHGKQVDFVDLAMAAFWPVTLVGFMLWTIADWGRRSGRDAAEALDRWWKDGERQ